MLYINYLLTERKPDYIIIWESWLNEKPTLLNQEYEIYQTKYSKYQGVCIIAKKNKVKKIHTSEEKYIISVEAKTNEKTYFIIGVYFKQNIKCRILEQVKRLITRIKKTYSEPEIVVFWDLNPDKIFTPEYAVKIMKLNIWELNRTIITREQKQLETTSESTLDYFFTNMQITSLESLDKNDSDHYPLLINLQITGKTTKSKWKIAYSKHELNDYTIHSILKNKDWPTTTHPNRNKNTLFRKYTIRPTVKLQSEANKIFKQNY